MAAVSVTEAKVSRHGLFVRGGSPSPEMRAKMALAQRRRWAGQPTRGQQRHEEFMAHLQRLLDECHAELARRREQLQ